MYVLEVWLLLACSGTCQMFGLISGCMSWKVTIKLIITQTIFLSVVKNNRYNFCEEKK